MGRCSPNLRLWLISWGILHPTSILSQMQLKFTCPLVWKDRSIIDIWKMSETGLRSWSEYQKTSLAYSGISITHTLKSGLITGLQFLSMPPICLSNNIWLILPWHNSFRFAICPKCVTIDDEIRKASTTRERLMWKTAKAQHHKYVRVERTAYMAR